MKEIKVKEYETESNWNTSIEPKLILSCEEEDYDLWNLEYRVNTRTDATHSTIIEFWDIRSGDLEAMGKQFLKLAEELKKVERLL